MNEQTLNNLSLSEAILIQNELSRKIVLSANGITSVESVAGVDLAYWKVGDDEYAVCCIVVLEERTKRTIESKYSFGKVEVPCIPGCLAFRELPLILETVKKLDTIPDLYMFDGNGYLHPRHMGIATHVSFYLDKPTIGVAKSYYKIDNVNFSTQVNEKNA